jgi:hypothetical protein
MEDCKDSEQTIYFTLGACSLNEYALKLAEENKELSYNDLIYVFKTLSEFVIKLYV